MAYLEDTPEYSDFYAVYQNIVNTTSTGFTAIQVLSATSLQIMQLYAGPL